MSTTSTDVPAGSPAHRSSPPRSVFAKVMSALHGDKYLADAYPPEFVAAAPVHAPSAPGDDTAAPGR
jgi:hypothetical protein